MWIKNTINGTWAEYRKETGIPYLNQLDVKEGNNIVRSVKAWAKRKKYNGIGNAKIM